MAEDNTVEIPRVQLGNQGLEVSKLGFGCMGLTGVYNSPVADEDGISIIKDAFSKGITFFDTSDVYGPHLNEVLIGKALKQLPREKIQLATKFGITGTVDPPAIAIKGTPEYVRSACEASLKRLGVDYIDLYYQHRVDTSVPIEETIGELKKLVEEGKVKYIGLSEASPDTIRRAHAVHPITAVQMEWSLWTRDIEEEIIPLCRWCNVITYRELGIGIVPYSPLVKKPYQLLNVWILREYLELEMQINDPRENFKFALERIIDDFIFMCFMAGNDFLPHMPTLEIHECAVDLLMTVYKKEFKNLGGYMVDMLRQVNDKKSGYIKLSRVEKFILLVGAYEDKIFKKRSELRERKLRRLFLNKDFLEDEIDAGSSTTDSSSTCALPNGEESEALSLGTIENMRSQIIGNTKEFKQKLKDSIRRKSDLFKNGDLGTDKVQYAAAGYKERYYKYKFSAEGPGDIESKRKQVVKYYTEGLLWVLLYYFSGPPSWTWFYPFHYSPFASDLKGLGQVKPKFEKGSPFLPIDTLMAVLPPRSAHALPKVYQTLMTDESSTIIDFYPSDFEIDMDGKRFTWQGICKLPFIEEERHLSETRKLEKELVGEGRDRNKEKVDQLFVLSTHNMASQIVPLFTKENCPIKIDNSLCSGISGFLRLHENASSVKRGYHKLQEHSVLCVRYELPNDCPHVPRFLAGVEFPVKTITEDDLMETKLWHEYQGSTRSTSSQLVQERFRKPDNMGNRGFWNNARFTSSSPNMIHKFSGTGWGSGRGKAIASPDFGDRFHAPGRLPCERVMSSSSYSANGAVAYKKASLNETPVCNEKWRVAGSGSGDQIRTLRDLKISKSSSSQGWRPNGRVQSANNVFWPSRNGFTPDTNHAWQHGQCRGRGHQDSSKHYSPFVANRSSQASGSAHFVPRSWDTEGKPRW